MTHKPPQGIYARVRELRSKLGDLLADEDLTDEKLREASEGLLPNIYDALAPPDPRKDLAALENAIGWAESRKVPVKAVVDSWREALAEMRGAKR